MERIVILDFGAQYNQLIARAVRECGVYSELLPPTATIEQIRGDGLSALILSGSYDSVYKEGSRTCTDEIFSLGVPILGICYGMQLISHKLGGKVEPAPVKEFGRTFVRFKNDRLFEGIPDSIMWMNHNDWVCTLPEGFGLIAETDDCAHGAMSCPERNIYAVQFHPEVKHSEYRLKLFDNFVHGICGCKGGWSMDNLAGELIEQVRAQVGSSRVVAGLSGGVDSSVAATLVHRAIGDKLTCIFVDHGLLRENEAEEVMDHYRDIGLNVVQINAKKRFLDRLAGITEPEAKRKIIGEEFIRVFEEEAKKIGAEYLLQGTIYPDVIESGAGGAAVIKSHHNVGGLPKDIGFKGLVEPLRSLFKDEVRELGEKLGMPSELVWRQPFPGPGLGIRVIGDITEEKLDILRKSDFILRDEIKKAGLDRAVWQYFTVFTGVRSVGVQGDDRTYHNVIAVRAVSSTDAMTVEVSEIPFETLRRISARIIAETPSVNRVVYDITDKPPGTIEWE